MGMYYGLINKTRNQGVSSYWKGEPPNPEEVMIFAHVLGWKTSDVIVAACYCRTCTFKEGDWVDFSDEPETNEPEANDVFDANALLSELTNDQIEKMTHFPLFTKKGHCKKCNYQPQQTDHKLGDLTFFCG